MEENPSKLVPVFRITHIIVLFESYFIRTMYSDGAINSTVAFLISGLRVDSPNDFVAGSQLKSSGTEKYVELGFQKDLGKNNVKMEF